MFRSLSSVLLLLVLAAPPAEAHPQYIVGAVTRYTPGGIYVQTAAGERFVPLAAATVTVIGVPVDPALGYPSPGTTVGVAFDLEAGAYGGAESALSVAGRIGELPESDTGAVVQVDLPDTRPPSDFGQEVVPIVSYLGNAVLENAQTLLPLVGGGSDGPARNRSFSPRSRPGGFRHQGARHALSRARPFRPSAARQALRGGSLSRLARGVGRGRGGGFNPGSVLRFLSRSAGSVLRVFHR